MHNTFVNKQLENIPIYAQGKKFGDTKFGQWGSNGGFQAIGNAASIISNASTEQSALSNGINQGIHAGLNTIGPMGMAISAGLKIFDSVGGALGAKIDTLDETDASKAGLTGANTANQVIGGIPGVGTLAGAFAGKTDKGYKSYQTESAADAFGGSVDAINSAVKMGGKKMLFGRKKANRYIREQNEKNRKITSIVEQNKLSSQNSIGDTIAANMQNLYSGYQPKLVLSKHGMKFPELIKAKELVNSLSIKSTKTSNLQKFQLGGKMNLIPEGALHARKHDIASSDPDLKGQITTKGIPVISESEGGVIQHAEIEKEEWTLRKEFTDQLEDLYKKYQENPSDELAIEAGKLICYELLKNTDDRSGLIKSIK